MTTQNIEFDVYDVLRKFDSTRFDILSAARALEEENFVVFNGLSSEAASDVLKGANDQLDNIACIIHEALNKSGD